MIIEREILLGELYEFSIAGSGLIVGKPGIGKSYLINQLRNRIFDNGIAVLLLKIDTLLDYTDLAITTELGLSTNWVEALKIISLKNGQKAVLIFDAFDAARDEQLRRGFLNQIRRALKELSGTCNIIVSVRTYDATKSPELIKLFGANGINDELTQCRKKEVNELSNEEVLKGIKGNKQFESLFSESGSELKEVLRIPFFLVLLEVIINGASVEELEEIKKYKSEVQLLQAYWKKKIINNDDHFSKEQFLLRLTEILVENRSLTISKSNFYKDNIQITSTAFHYLRSENIIDEVSVNSSRLSYSHNILFDYAVSLYCISEKFNELLHFINKDSTRPFFLRPSFVYFFTSVWYIKRDVFWNLYWRLFEIDSKEIQLLIRLVLNGIIVSEYTDTNELIPIIANANIHTKTKAITNLLQSIRFIRKKGRGRDADLLLLLSQELEMNFIFDVAFLIDEAVKEVRDGDMDKCGKAARNIFRYVLSNRTKQNKVFLDKIGAFRGISLIAQTYYTNVKESREYLSEIFNLLNEEDFEIQYFLQLCDAVKYILDFDSDFVARIYEVVFGYNESSDKETNMGGSVIMNLTSNRWQDYESCYFRLHEFVLEFLSKATYVAIKVVLKIVNDYVIKYKSPTSFEAVEFELSKQKFSFCSDYSSVWGQNIHHDYRLNIAKKLIQFFEELIGSGDTNFEDFIQEYIRHANVGFTWRLLFELGAKYPEKLIQQIFPFVSPLFLRSPDTAYSLRDFIQQASPYFNDNQIGIVEEAAFASFEESETKQIAAVLSRLPAERFQLSKSHDVILSIGIIENAPPITFFSSVSNFTDEMWLEERGVDISTPENRNLINTRLRFESFNNIWRNEIPLKENFEQELAIAIDTFDVIIQHRNELHTDLFYSILRELTSTVSIISRNLSDCSVQQLQSIKSIISFSFNFISEFESENEYKSPAEGYAPTPKIEAAEALLFLYINERDEDILELWIQAINDKMPVVRYTSVKKINSLVEVDYEMYWKFFLQRLIEEDDSFTCGILLGNLHIKLDRVKRQAIEIIDIAISKDLLFTFRNSFVDSFADTLIWLFRSHKSQRALEAITDAISKPFLCFSIIFRLFKELHPSYPQNEFHAHPEKYIPLFEIIISYIERSGKVLSGAQPDDFNSDKKEIKYALEIVHEVILRIYFQLEAETIGRNQNKITLPINEENRKAFYFLIKPIYLQIVQLSSTITKRGLIVGQTAHFFIEALNKVLQYDVKAVLSMATAITQYAAVTGYTYDLMAIKEMVKLTEKLLADHRDILLDEESFKNLIDLLDIYINSGSIEALQLLWRLDEVFR